MVQDKNLVKLLRRLRTENNCIDRISASLASEGLNLAFDLGTGLEGYETLVANPRDSRYSVEYTGMFSAAFRSFLAEEYSGQVNRSIVLREFKQEIQAKKRGPVEISDVGRNNIYGELLILRGDTRDYTDLEEAFVSMSGIFRDKSKRN